jgi:hypothetical protein
MDPPLKSRAGVPVIMVAVALLSVISHRWTTRTFETIPPPWDQGLYLYMAFKYWNALMDGGLLALSQTWLFLIQSRGTLFPLSTLGSFFVFGPSFEAAYLTNALYLGVMLASVFKTAELIGGWRAGFLGALICATTPALINYSRDYLLDFPMAAVITAAIYTLLRSDLFRRRWHSLVFGVWSGLAILVKPMAAAYLFPLGVYAVLVASARAEGRGRLFPSLGLAAVGFALVAAPWYSVNLVHALGNLMSAGFGASSVPYRDAGEAVFTWRNMSYYPRHVLGYGLGLPYAILFLSLAIWRGTDTWRERKSINRDWRPRLARPSSILVVWLLIMYVVLTLTPNKDRERYALALLPTIAVLSACWIRALFPVALRAVVTAGAVAIAVFNYWALTFGVAALPREVQWKGVTLLSQEHNLKRWFPYQQRWPIHDALATLASQAPGPPSAAAKIYVMPNHPMVNALTLMAHAEEKRYLFSFTIHGEKILDRDRIKSFEFVMAKTGEDQGPEFVNVGHEEARRAFEEVKPSFTLLRRLPLPDGSYLELFKRQDRPP